MIKYTSLIDVPKKSPSETNRMNTMKSCSIVAVFTLLIQSAYCQVSDYIATDSSATGIELIGGTAIDNAQFIRLKNQDKEVKYFPEDLIEYGFKNGIVYQSKNISVSGQTKKVFLERLEHGKITLYYYTEKGYKSYFLEKDSTTFVEISSEDDFRKQLSKYTNDFNWMAEQFKLVRYNRYSLSKLISIYNKGYNKPLPFPRFGLSTGYSRTSLEVPSDMSVKQLHDISFTASSSVSLGVFADLPIEMSYFSVNVGLNFSKSGFSVNSRTLESDTDVVVNFTSANLPVLLRYTWPSMFWRPFINAGVVYSFHLQNESEIYESTIGQNVVIINEVIQQSVISENMFGYSCGIGLQRNLNYRKIASAEIRFNQLTGNENTFPKSQFDILISFSF